MRSINNTATKGMSLTELATELERQKTAKRDFMADTKKVEVIEDRDSPTNLALVMDDVGRNHIDYKFPLKQHAVRQIGSRLKIPAQYADRLAEKHPDLLAHNITELFKREPENRMVRTLDGQVRAFLSDKYRPLDNFDFAEAVLPKLMEGNCDVTSCDITDTRLYIKAIVPGIQQVVKKPGTFHGDGGHNPIHTFKPGICLSNSEVGSGSLAVEPGIHEVDCSNLLIMGSNAMKKYHVGAKRTSDQEALWEVFTDNTKRTSDAAFWMQVRDLVDAGLNGELFAKMVAECEAKMNGTEISRPTAAIRELPNTTEAEQEGILAQLIKGGDLSQFGMQWAVTRFAQEEAVSYERQVELERIGGNIIELPTTQWERIAEAA